MTLNNSNRAGVILAGGSGERFWPLSRKNRPKQLLAFTHSNQTMLAAAVARLEPLIARDRIFVVTGEHLIEPIREANVGIPDENVLAEPAKRNTAGALAYAAANLIARYGDDGMNVTMAVTTADHIVGDDERFRQTIAAAIEAAEHHDVLATLGITPTRPETGYGYIQAAEDDGPIHTSAHGIDVFPVRAFHEKPDAPRAQEFVDAGDYYWNSGMFFWRIGTFLAELEQARPDLASATIKIAQMLRAGNVEEARRIFEDEFEDISIDFALMEKASRVVVAPADFPWDDVGAWPAIERTATCDDAHNVVVGEAIVHDCCDSIVYNDAGADVAVGVAGLRDMVVVVTRDAVLVIPKDRAQEVRTIVEQLKARDAKQI